MSVRRGFGITGLIEEALTRPPHNPRVKRPHVADEYADLAARAGTATVVHANRVIAAELRRGLRAR